ncbi:MAG: hypothetical protein H6652_23595 [Ardenticatenaceae bacterium]|nr:hypothetical protein [Ardenticatenaceae bacterium]
MSADLLQTKLFTPRLRPSLVHRPRLIEKLNNGLSGKLTLVSAPAGFGKTTVVVAWMMACDMPAVWLSLDEEDSDPVRFWRYLIAGLQTIHADFGTEILQLFAQTPPPPMQTAVTALINAISKIPNEIIFVLDDYHLIDSQTTHEALTYFLERQPPQLHLVITTREDPPIPLPRWRARGDLTEIRERDLKFTAAEATALLNETLALDLTTAQIEKLFQKTEGWVSGLQLAALALREQADAEQFVNAFAGSNRFILDYLIEEVFRQQPPDVRTFLLQTAVLERLTAPLCDAVMAQEGNSQTILERLEQANLFTISLDQSRQWFRYHHLFADLLRQRLRLEQVDTAVLHQRAAHWHEENGFYRRAINHYLQAAAWEQAATLIQARNDDIQKQGENRTFLRWMETLPNAVIEAMPDLCLGYAWALALSGQPDAANHFLAFAEEAFRDNPPKYGAVLSAQIHLARSRHDLPQTIALSETALAMLPPAAHNPRSALLLNLGIAHWQLGQITEAEKTLTAAQEAAKLAQNHHVQLLAIGFLAMTQVAQGQLPKAATLLQAALAWGEALPASALPHMVLAGVLYEWNQLEEARAHLQTAIDLAQRSGNSELTSSAYRQWALLLLAQGDAAAAQAALATAENAAGTQAPPHTQARNDAVAVMIALAQSNLEKAQEKIEMMPAAVSASPFYVPLFLAPARLALARDDRAAAAAHLMAEYEKAEAGGWRYGQIEIRLLQALAAGDDSLRFFTDALTLAQPGNFRRIFLDKGPALLPLLHLAVSKQILPDYSRMLLALFAGTPPPVPASPPPEQTDTLLVDAVSEREIEVLQLLANGRTYKEIAQELFVSVNTIKSHLKSIYGKLGVNNRREAVAQARLLHLISHRK